MKLISHCAIILSQWRNNYCTLFSGGHFRSLFFGLSRIPIIYSQGDSITWTRGKNLKSSDVVGRRRFTTLSETSYIIYGNNPFTFYGRSHRCGFLFGNAQWRLAFVDDCQSTNNVNETKSRQSTKVMNLFHKHFFFPWVSDFFFF